MKVLVASIIVLATSASSPLTSSVEAIAPVQLLYIPAWEASTDSNPEVLMTEVGQDGPLGHTCWSHTSGEIAKTGFIKPDGTVLWDNTPDIARCPAMD